MPSTFLKHIYVKIWIPVCAVEQLHEEEEEEQQQQQIWWKRREEKREGERCGEEVVVDNKEGTDEFGTE